MKKVLLYLFLGVLPVCGRAQSVSQKLQAAWKLFASDPQMEFALGSLYVIDAVTGQVIFDRNSRTGLAPASTQKIITSATAFALLGKEYRYKTEFSTCTGNGNTLCLCIKPTGDPSFGSSRWESTSDSTVINGIAVEIRKKAALKNYKYLCINATGWNYEQIPDGWIWQDIGNYYGAGSGVLNWRENQYDLFLHSGAAIGDPVKIAGTEPADYFPQIQSELVSAGKGSGDNAYIYLPSTGPERVIRGTIPVKEDHFRISGSVQNPLAGFTGELIKILDWQPEVTLSFKHPVQADTPFYTYFSPPLDSIIYWLNKKSINLYAEALLKTMAYEAKGQGSTDSGIVVLKDFWKKQGIDPRELNLYDGSGLSPMNRVTTHAQVEILKYARQQGWYGSFHHSLPVYNGMTMKSGTIGDVKGFTGYQKAADGKEYIFSFLINNYNGPSSALVAKMYKLLDLLK